MIGFGNFSKKNLEATIITALTDTRLMRIDPQEEHFFDSVLNFKTTDEDINLFIEAVREVKEAKLDVFYKPIYDPSDAGENLVTYQKGKEPSVGHSYNWWCKTAENMPKVEERCWSIASEYQYYAFLVYLVNELVKSGKFVEEAIMGVVTDSKELGHYLDSDDSTKGNGLEPTGSRCICGVYDLSNTFKILRCSNYENVYWAAGGVCTEYGAEYPLADISNSSVECFNFDYGVGMLVL